MKLQQILKICRVNWYKTLLFNIKTFPIVQAVKLPVILFGKCLIINTHRGGKINAPVRAGMLQIGRLPDHRIYGNHSISPCVINIKGKLILNGDHVFLGLGTMIAIEQHAEIAFGEDIQMVHNTILFASKKLSLETKLASLGIHSFSTPIFIIQSQMNVR